MAAETRIERWRRTGLLQIVVAAIVFAVWIYFQTQFAAADRPVILNEVLLLALGWLGGTFLFGKDKDAADKTPEPKDQPLKNPEPEPEPESRGRHAK